MTTTTIILPSPLGLAQISRFPFCKNSWEGKSTQWRLGLLSISFGSWPFSYFYLRCITVQECWWIIYNLFGARSSFKYFTGSLILVKSTNFPENSWPFFSPFFVRFKNVCHFWILFKGSQILVKSKDVRKSQKSIVPIVFHIVFRIQN